MCACLVCDGEVQHCANSQTVEGARRGTGVPAACSQPVSSMFHSLMQHVHLLLYFSCQGGHSSEPKESGLDRGIQDESKK